ncbi:hypothetical protein FDT80_17580 [Sulfitobacter sabulilitoris]|uniref:Cytochrome C n=1 Tax=Sulfitobacter sabulilitoris TaxID=2562655 RepID=A0A5S3P7Y3_9RHOB|nr:hypothetical protein FDT80_17580 [Sulfitobacter sabulilitoris]
MLITAVSVCLGGGAVQAQSASECDPIDQLACSCKTAAVKPVNNTVNACFIGDVNTITANQADGFTAKIFAAINWPVKLDENGKAMPGVPDYQAKLDGSWTAVWETWKSTNQIFRGDQPPLPWDSTAYPLPAACAELDLEAAMASVPYAADIPMTMQPRLLDEYLNPEGRALLDRNGVPVRYDVIFNKQAYDYTVENKLFDARGLEGFLHKNGKLSMPKGFWIAPANGKQRGAIVLKSSWMVLDAKHDPMRFHKAWAYITPLVENGKVTHDCALRPVGLVGLHVIYKTDQFKKWGWGTFEHDTVAPTWAEVGDTAAGVYADGASVPQWLFYSRDQDGAAKLNTPPKHAAAGIPSRVVAFYPPGYYAEPIGVAVKECSAYDQNFRCINARLKSGFANSPLRNYRLHGTQWELLDSNGRLLPEILGNATMETYTQNTSSCQSCHSFARPDQPGAARETLDFIFSFNRDVLQRSSPVQGNK